MHAPRRPFVLWPAPGSPAVLGPGERSFEVLVVGGRSAGGPAPLAGDLALRRLDTGERVGLAIDSIEPAPHDWAKARAAHALALADLERASSWRLRLSLAAAPAPAPPRRVAVADLVSSGFGVRSRAVAFCAPGRAPLHIAFASDLHVAALFDELEAAVERFAPDLVAGFHSPSRHLERMVEELGARAAQGELDALVLGGDIVDHAYRVPRRALRGERGEANVVRVIEALATLPVPSFAIPGNHDFRLSPWRLRSYGLGELGLPAARVPEILRQAGLWDAWPFVPSDLDALRSRSPDGRSALAPHLLELAPRTDSTATIGDLDLVLASAGRDVLPRFRSVEKGRRRLLVAALATSWIHPDLEGLFPEQLDAIERSLEAAARAGRGAALFVHAPLLQPPDSGSVEERIPRLDPPVEDSLGSDIAFERALRRSGLRRGVIFRHPARLVRALLWAGGDVALFAGHVHRGHAIELSRSDRSLRSTPFAAARSDAERIALLTTPALGQTNFRGDEVPGFLVARFESGSLRGVERVAVRADPSDSAGRA